jgi:hypothetical protein
MSAGVETEWYYVGQYGEIGPLSLEQMRDLVQDKVVEQDTYVWRRGMTDWVHAGQVTELSERLKASALEPPPPPPQTAPKVSRQPLAVSHAIEAAAGSSSASRISVPYGISALDWRQLEASLPVSDKKRTTAGLLNFVPGAGRFYLGYSAHGVLQLLLTLLCGIGLIWAWIDAIFMLCGGLKYDGYGRVLKD